MQTEKPLSILHKKNLFRDYIFLDVILVRNELLFLHFQSYTCPKFLFKSAKCQISLVSQ